MQAKLECWYTGFCKLLIFKELKYYGGGGGGAVMGFPIETKRVNIIFSFEERTEWK